MKTLARSCARTRRAGFALAELLLAVAVIALMVGISAGAYGLLRSDINADDQATKTIALAADIQRNWRNAGSYVTLLPVEINKLALIQKPLKWDGANVQDGYGNIMSIAGGSTSFVITTGGAVNPIGKEDCASIANRLATGVATNVSIGTTAAAGAGGLVTGGNAFKVGTTINQTSLATGCNEPNPVIAASFR